MSSTKTTMKNNNNSNHHNQEPLSTITSSTDDLNRETPNHNSGMSLISSNRQYSVGMGKDQQPNSRLWIEAADDPTLVHLYCLIKSDDDKDVFICGHCKQHNRITAVEILHPDGGKTELFEQQTHFVTCTRQKLDVEKILLGFDEPIPVPPRQQPRKVQPSRRSRADTPPSRSRSRSPLQSSATAATSVSVSTSSNNTRREHRGKKPNLQAMSIIPKTNWRLKTAENGVVDVDTKLFILTNPKKSIGREYSYGVTFDGGVLFYCDNCLFLTRERQKRKAFYKVIRGKVVIREANHYPTCRPSELRHVCDASAEDNDEFGPAAGGDEEDASMEDERSYDSQEPETTIEYDSTTASSPDIPEPPPPSQPPKPTQRRRGRTLKSKQIPASAKIPSSKTPTFRPVFDSETPISGGTAGATNKQRDRLPPPPRRIHSSAAAAPATAAPRVLITSSSPIYVPFQQHHPTPSTPATVAPEAVATPSQPIITLRRLPPANIPAEFQPYLLPADRTLIYNTPSSGQMREIATKFGFPFSYKCYQFWSSTLSTISEINVRSKVSQIHPLSPTANEFSCLSLFLTGAEEYGQLIQEGIKEYFCNTYFTNNGFTLPRDIVQHFLITNAITDVHLHILSKMISCSIVVFNGSKIEIFGLTTDETTPLMLLKKTDTKYEPVLGISN